MGAYAGGRPTAGWLDHRSEGAPLLWWGPQPASQMSLTWKGREKKENEDRGGKKDKERDRLGGKERDTREKSERGRLNHRGGGAERK